MPRTIACEELSDQTREVIADAVECRRDAVHTPILTRASDIPHSINGQIRI